MNHILLLTALLLRSDEAILPNGTRLAGKLQAGNGPIQFVSDAGKTWALDQLQQVRFAEVPCATPKIPISHRVMLSQDHWLSGELVAVDETIVHFRAWTGKELKIARKNLLAVAQPAEWRALSRESFEKAPADWTFSDPKVLRDDAPFTGTKSIILDRPKQEASWSPAHPLATGRVSLFLRQSDNLKDQELRIAWSFRKGKESRVVELRLDGAKFIASEPGGLSIEATAGWHLLQVDLSAATLRFSVDGFVLHSEPTVADNSLVGLKLMVTTGAASKTAAGFWSIDDVQVMRLEPALPWPKRLPDADTVWLPEGDQIFGKVAKADGATATLEGRFGTRTFAWKDLRGIIFSGDQPAVKVDDAVTLWVAPAPGYPADRIAGTLLSLSAETLVLRHGTLGEVSFDRKNCVKVVR